MSAIRSKVASVEMLESRDLAREMKLGPKELREMLEDDGVPVLVISARRWRVAAADWEAWKVQRYARSANEAEQRRRRFDLITGKAATFPTMGKVTFKR